MCGKCRPLYPRDSCSAGEVWTLEPAIGKGTSGDSDARATDHTQSAWRWLRKRHGPWLWSGSNSSLNSFITLCFSFFLYEVGVMASGSQVLLLIKHSVCKVLSIKLGTQSQWMLLPFLLPSRLWGLISIWGWDSVKCLINCFTFLLITGRTAFVSPFAARKGHRLVLASGIWV